MFLMFQYYVILDKNIRQTSRNVNINKPNFAPALLTALLRAGGNLVRNLFRDY